MTKSYPEITNTTFKNEYNIVKILTSVSDIMNYIKTQYKESKDSAVAFGYRKKLKITLEDVIIEMRNGFKQINTRIDNIETRLTNVEDRLDRNHIY